MEKGKIGRMLEEKKENIQKQIFQIKLAGFRIEISCFYSAMKAYCKEYLVEDTEKADIFVNIAEADILYEEEKSKGEQGEFSKAYLETLAVYRKIAEALLEYDILLFHGSVIAVDGQAFIFTAKSGTGKSTHTRLWREYFGERAVMVNDDKPLLKVSKEGLVVYGTPWNGKHRLGSNMSATVKGICILKRAEQNAIQKIDEKQAYPMLLQQTYRMNTAEGMIKTLKLVEEMAKQADLYELGCNMELEAAKVAYEGMRG